jgi:hypothetical protein
VGNLHLKYCDSLIQRAETERDLDKVRRYVEDVEAAIHVHTLHNSHGGNGDAVAMRRIGDRLLKIKSEQLKWPVLFDSASDDGV